jgi:Ca2+:H+ antiporter
MWAVLIPIASIALLVVYLFLPVGATLAIACAGALIGAVICTVHHAEVVTLRVGERFGALVLALAMTIIEVALILTLMSPGGPEKATLPRDTLVRRPTVQQTPACPARSSGSPYPALAATAG